MKLLLPGLVLLALCGQALANGGGYRYGLDFTGGIAPFEPSGTDNVRILDEKLDVRLEYDHAAVEVRYKMKNESDKSVKVKFGFPVEVVPNEMEGVSRQVANSAKQAGENCSHYAVTAGKPLEVTYLPEPFQSGKIKPFPGSEKLAGIAGWQVSELKFEKGEEREVSISYQSAYDKEEWSISDDESIAPLRFRYRLSTGGVWKDSIAHGQVRVTAAGVDPDEVKVTKPAGRFARQGASWVWNFDNLEPTLADDIEIEAVPGAESHADFWSQDHARRSYVLRSDVWSLVSNDFTATASSTLARQEDHGYEASNLAPGEHDEHHQVWAEGAEGDGIGESLSLKPKRTSKLYGISIAPGYVTAGTMLPRDASPDARDLFHWNNRPSVIELELNGEFKMPIALADKPALQFFRIKGYNKPVKSVKLIIRGVYRGTKWQDTCISEVLLHEQLDKKPKLHPVR